MKFIYKFNYSSYFYFIHEKNYWLDLGVIEGDAWLEISKVRYVWRASYRLGDKTDFLNLNHWLMPILYRLGDLDKYERCIHVSLNKN